MIDKNDIGALHESLNLETSSCDRKDREAFISSGSYPHDLAAAKTSVVFPIPGVPHIKTLYDGVFFLDILQEHVLHLRVLLFHLI